MGKSESELALVGRWLCGDQDAGHQLVDTYYEKLYRYVWKKLQKRNLYGDLIVELAHEICQDTWAEIIGDLQKFNGKSSFFTWICGYADNYLLTKLRKYQQKNACILGTEEELVSQDYDKAYEDTENENEGYFGDPEIIYIRKETKQEIQRALSGALSQLKPEHQDVIHRRLYLRQTCKEIAGELGKTDEAIESLYLRAIQALKREYLKIYATKTDGFDAKRSYK